MHAKQTLYQLSHISSPYNVLICNQNNRLRREDVIKIHEWFLSIIYHQKLQYACGI